MKVKIALVFIICSITNHLTGQFAVSISASKTNACKTDTIIFKANATNGGVSASNVSFTWSFGDNSGPNSGFMLDSVTNKFSSDGGYIVRVDATDGVNSDYALMKIQIGLKPNFSGTTSDKKEQLCLGQQIFLTGKANTNIWKYKTPNTNTEKNPFLVSNTSKYSAKFDYRIFNKGQTVASASNIDSIGINLEHSNISDLKIELKCPNGTTIVLKNFGGADKYFGVPVDIEGSSSVGVGYDYFWTNTPTYGTMNSQNPITAALPSGTYTPDQAFSNLIGCPLNGIWELTITDNQSLDNGFVFSDQLKFNSTLFPPTSWQFSNTYSSPLWLGHGVSSTSGSGLATAVPVAIGANPYSFRVKDNYGCFQDTSFNVRVDPVTFTTNPDPPSGDFNLSIDFNNTTKWGTNFEWDFRDKSPLAATSSVTHIYTKEGNYWAKLKASTDDGCSDTASVLVTVTIPQSALSQIPNVFTPNGDGFNDKFSINESSLKGIATLDCWIYSRWGKKVAEWHSVEDAKNGWDGNINGGPPAAPGVYYYYIKAVGYDSKVYKPNGTFQLFR